MDHRRFEHKRRHPGPKEKGRGHPPEGTEQEVTYIKYLIEHQVPVRIRLSDNSEVSGVIEYYDQSFIRLTRQNQPNLFIFKQEIKYLYEEP